LAEAVIDLAPTITVADSFGNDTDITRADFTKRWTDHISELRSLQPSLSSKRIGSIAKEISNAAAAEFDRIYMAQEHKGNTDDFDAINWTDSVAAYACYLDALSKDNVTDAVALTYTESEHTQIFAA